jgi:hypothetical protein
MEAVQAIRPSIIQDGSERTRSMLRVWLTSPWLREHIRKRGGIIQLSRRIVIAG